MLRRREELLDRRARTGLGPLGFAAPLELGELREAVEEFVRPYMKTRSGVSMFGAVNTAVAVAATWAHWPAGGKKARDASPSPSYAGVMSHLYVSPFMISQYARRVVP